MSVAPIRIGYVIGQLSQGGAERQLYELVRGLDPRRFHCVVYCLSERTSPYGDLIEAAGAELRVLKRHSHFDLTRLLRLASHLRRDRIDILHAFLYLANGYAWPARLLAGIPHLVTSARNCKEVGWLRGWGNRCAFRLSDAIICNGEAVRAFIVRHYRASRVHSMVIYNGLDLERFAMPPAPTGGDVARERPGERRVITVGRLVPQKDHELFLEAAALLAREAVGVRFLIVGDGPCRAKLEQHATCCGLDGKVAFLGERSDIPHLLHGADVFWLTSSREGLPNVLLEAMACGKPIVARDVGACREAICHGVNGYLVPGRDAGMFVDYTLDLLSNFDKASAMGDAGRRLVEEQFSAPAMIQATAQLYGALLDSRTGIADRGGS